MSHILIQVLRPKFGYLSQVLVLIEVDALTLPLKWEPSRGGDLFPHLYVKWKLSGLEKTWILSLDENDIPLIPI